METTPLLQGHKVSSDILRVSGYSNQFRNLLSARPTHSRRESGPGALVTDFAQLKEVQDAGESFVCDSCGLFAENT
ncbi:hypothetical protein QR680_004899 [Steinernema hermaphroditum]|uniref:Uncharacterized protein n=1 Tax=Steinernema hermaphroditum TaxID=289476 RepID=A0AA39HRM2_9BILA|nr:hypothetical protein QR680_004899 [Steinernema hermaphroditum]